MRAYLLSALTVVFVLYGCNPHAPQNTSTETALPQKENTVTEKGTSDTTLPQDSASHYILETNGGTYHLVLEEDGLNDTDDNTPAVTLQIKNAATGQWFSKQTLPYNTIDDIYSPAPGKYWLSLILSGGGSGYSGTLFDIMIKDTVTLRPILNFDELFYLKRNKAGNEILVFQGVWNMGDPDSEEFESHFSEHKQVVRLYHITDDTIRVTDIGTTTTKYNFFEDVDAVTNFKTSDPLAKQINWLDYDLKRQD